MRLISGSLDWFKATNKAGATEDNAFDATWGLPELGVNCFRSEIMARVFSEVTITSSKEHIHVVKGSSSLVPQYKLAKLDLPYTERIIGFKFSDGV